MSGANDQGGHAGRASVTGGGGQSHAKKYPIGEKRKGGYPVPNPGGPKAPEKTGGRKGGKGGLTKAIPQRRQGGEGSV